FSTSVVLDIVVTRVCVNVDEISNVTSVGLGQIGFVFYLKFDFVFRVRSVSTYVNSYIVFAVTRSYLSDVGANFVVNGGTHFNISGADFHFSASVVADIVVSSVGVNLNVIDDG